MRESGSLEQQLLEYKAILEHSGIAVVCTRNRRVYRCNPRAEELFGWPAGTLVGQPDLVFYPDSAACETLRRQARAALRVGEILDLETQLARRDGSIFVAHLIARAIDPAAPGQGAVWIVRDVTQEVDAREAGARLLREQQLIFQNAETGIVILRDRAIQRCNRRFAEILGYEPDELIGCLTRIYYPSEEAWLETGRKAYAAISETGIYRGETTFIRRDGAAIWSHITGSMINPAKPQDGYIWLYEDVTEKRQASRAMDALLREQTLIFERAPIGIVFVRERIIQRCNPSFERIFGYLPGQLIGQSMRVCFASELAWREADERVVRGSGAGGTFIGEIEYCKADGAPIWCQVTGSLLDPENHDQGHVWLFQDITARRAAEEALVESLWEQQLIFDNAMIGISYQRERTIWRCNRRFEEIFGYPVGAMTGQSTRILFATEKAWEDAGREVYGDATGSGSFDGEFLFSRRDGTPIWVHIIGRTIDDGDARQTWIWTHEDVTAHRAAQEALRQSHLELEQRVAERTHELSQQLDFMHQLVEAIPGPVFYKNRQGRYLGCNQAFLEMIGKSRREVVGATVYDVAPRELANRYMAADEELFQRSGSQVYETQVLRADGNYRDVVFHKAIYGMSDEVACGLVGIMLDVTERKRMEQRLQQAATVFDSSAEGITITSPNGEIIAVNRAFTEITGYSEDDVVGGNPRLLQSGFQDPEFYREMWRTLHTCGRWRGELWNRRKDGQAFLESLTISAVKDPQDRVTHYVGVFSDITELRKAHDQLDHQAHHDPLTGLPNRLLLGDRLHKALQRAHRDERGLAVLFVDLDRFKNINDTLGHQVGDRVLCEVARRLTRLRREADTVGRLGGDEFLIIIEDLGDAAAVSHIAERILALLQDSPVTVEHEFYVGASIGISLFPQDGGDAETLMKNADVAMYRAKERGRNTYEFFTKELTQSSLARLQMETDLRRAIDRGELRVFLQPQFSLTGGELVGAEALVRWLRPERGLVMPGEFIRLAEESGLIVPIGEWVQHTAACQWAAWLGAGLKPGVLSVNVSGVEFQRGRIQETACKTLESSQLPAQFLELEITESAIMTQAESSVQVLDALRAMGLGLVIDDFGTGYSSLAYLKRLPLNKLKIDQSFVRGLPGDAEDRAITRAVIALAHSLQLTVIAEGVESEAQRDFLAGEGCDEMQGYLRGRPMPLDDYRQRFLEG
ncbi:MAG: PAS domain S-box protein [Candidatus Accumulibacter sp.]|jgi:diguanylate cyclase (GGDEF)-like protein/PAS domain S-box-containing protein|uniref:sensor domain-containing protein n=1 Tax=unclassified Candidatus Accumulibacter TaxID=2619054 RepID=UPI001A4EA3EB|nr:MULTISPECIES: PAS domain S-box protein [unclassified Candidatus Accumulibacter]MBL8369421.1 PAS domain S-box protein [Accumulibacter sp.]MBN8515258.1 PAS domain S-box protein [Accumulibacter sp.]MBO3701327.1 PAS domain S-box protein [Accumulibacter sp.]HRI92528.1 PAS domain S-box protein [Accumulibacter sp.]